MSSLPSLHGASVTWMAVPIGFISYSAQLYVFWEKKATIFIVGIMCQIFFKWPSFIIWKSTSAEYFMNINEILRTAANKWKTWMENVIKAWFIEIFHTFKCFQVCLYGKNSILIPVWSAFLLQNWSVKLHARPLFTNKLRTLAWAHASGVIVKYPENLFATKTC